MRAVVQRVDRARVEIGGETISEIGKGVLVFLGIEKDDGEKDARYLLQKIINLRLFDDPQGRMNLSILEVAGDMLVVSQFTLLADCRKGRRPSFIAAAEPEMARVLYEYFISLAGEHCPHVGSGRFQAPMKVESVNDGPVTLLLDSRRDI